MIVNERMKDFLDSFDTGNTAFLEELEKRSLRENVPIVRRDTQRLLKTLMVLAGPMKILEVGTAVGFSTLLMCEAAPEGARITTIENDPSRYEKARENVRAAGREEQIDLLFGDAEEILASLTGEWDMIFLDAAKAQYIRWLPTLKELLKRGGMLVSDNVLQEGDLTESHFLVPRRDRTIYRRMRDFLYAVTHDPALSTVILPVGDGVALSVKQ